MHLLLPVMVEKITCKPTKWFLLRAIAITLLFAVFSVLFYKDGSTGYRDQNLSYYYQQAVSNAVAAFGDKQGSMSADEWRSFAAQQKVPLPEDHSVLPKDTPKELPWPELLGDYDKMKAELDSWRTGLFEPIRQEETLRAKVPDMPFDAKKIREQWIVFYICLALTLVSLFILTRTLLRKMEVDGDTFRPVKGAAVKIDDLIRLDLRGWKKKGLAYAWAKTAGGAERKIRIDGLTYGGYKQSDGEPAEKLMQAILAKFSGEIIDYEETEPEVETSKGEKTTATADEGE